MLKAFRALTPFALLVGLMMAAPAHAQKLGYVDYARLVQESPQFNAMIEMLEAEFAPRQRELMTLQQELQEKQETFQRDSSVLAESERTALERELRDGLRDFERQRAVLEEDFNIRRNEEIQKIERQVIEAVEAFGREERFDLILAQGALYVDSEMDITAAVLEQLSD